jgi:hypothetical protein
MTLSRELRITLNKEYGAGNIAVDMRDGSIRLLLKNIGTEMTKAEMDVLGQNPVASQRLELS